jgi:PAS domain S-box-containing protein
MGVMNKNFPFYDSLSFKIIGGVVFILCSGMGLLSYFLYNFHKSQLLETLQVSITNMSNIVADGLKHAMLENRLDKIQNMVLDISKGEGVERVMLLNKKGIIKVAHDPKLINTIIPIEDAVCQICHQLPRQARGTTVIFRTKEGEQVFRNVTPIANTTPCYPCHNPKDKLNGVMIMDFSMTKINSQLAGNMRQIFIWTLIMAILLILVIRLLINRLIIRKLGAFLKVAPLIGKGQLDHSIQIKGKDEMAQVAQCFNQMLNDLKHSLSMKEAAQQKEYLENIIDSMDDSIMVVDQGYRIVTANRAFLTKTKLSKEEVMGQFCYMVLHQSATPCNGIGSCQMEKVFREGGLQKTIYSYQEETVGERWVEVYFSPLRNQQGEIIQVIEVMRDITERKQLEAHLIHSERLASLGMLASGISHEIKNPLASITTALEGMQRRIKQHTKLEAEDFTKYQRYLDLIQKDAQRCKAIVDKLLLLSSKTKSYTDLIDINQALEETISLLEPEISQRNITISKDLTPGLPLLRGHESEMRQVFLNIILNGVQAIEKDGLLKIATSRENDGIKIVFTDTGCGIEKQDLKRIFEPFFTTKPMGTGTGLGLFISQNIIRQHKGQIFAESQPGKGTTFTLLLPVNPDS